MDNSNASDEFDDGTEPTPHEVEVATSEAFNETLYKLIEEADKLSNALNVSEPSEDTDIQVDQLPNLSHNKTILGDIFHFMDRSKLPMHHEYKTLFFRSLRAAIFIMNKSDVDEVKEVLATKPGTSWEKKMALILGT